MDQGSQVIMIIIIVWLISVPISLVLSLAILAIGGNKVNRRELLSLTAIALFLGPLFIMLLIGPFIGETIEYHLIGRNKWNL